MVVLGMEEEGGDVDAILEMIDSDVLQPLEGTATDGGAHREVVDELLGASALVGRGGSSSSMALCQDAHLPGVGAASDAGSEQALLSVRSGHQPVPLEPEWAQWPTMEVPSDVDVKLVIVTAFFDLKCDVDMQRVAFGLRHAEYNPLGPRRHSSITARLFDPHATALIRASGKVSISTSTNEELAKVAAKKFARLVQKCGHESAKFVDYRVTGLVVRASLGFPVRLEELARRYPKCAVYEPELYCGCVFKTLRPKRAFLVTAGGKVMITGCNTMDAVREALHRAYPVFHECRKIGRAHV